MKQKSAIQAIENHGLLLVYPASNTSDPPSLWSVAYPGARMRWEWDSEGDTRVAELWHLREALSRSRAVVYGKWFRGRATFFSRDFFRALLALYIAQPGFRQLSRPARSLLSLLEENSPQSTKKLKQAAGLVGRDFEPTYQRALKELWSRLLVVGFGEVAEGAFPSLALGATSLIFEDLYSEAQSLSSAEAIRAIARVLAHSPAADRCHRRVLASLARERAEKLSLHAPPRERYR